MIKIKDKKSGEVWKIYEKGERPRSHEIKDGQYIIPIAGYRDVYFDSLIKAVEWVGNQISLRRDSDKASKPSTFWNP